MAPTQPTTANFDATENVAFDLSKLEYYQKREAKRTMIARGVLLTMIFAMMVLNVAMTQRNYEAVVVNMDQTRLAQDQLIDGQTEHVQRLEARLDHLEVMVLAQAPPVAVVALAD